MAHLEIHTRAVALEKPVLLASCFFVPTVLGPWLYGFQSEKLRYAADAEGSSCRILESCDVAAIHAWVSSRSPFATDGRARHFARRARTAVRASAPHTRPGARQGRRPRLAPSGSSAPPPRRHGLFLILGVRDDDGDDGGSGARRAPRRVPGRAPRRAPRASPRSPRAGAARGRAPRARRASPRVARRLDARQLRGRREEGWREEGWRVFAPCQARRRGRERQNERRKARRGLDPDLFAGAERVAAVPSGDRAGAAATRRGGNDERTGAARARR